MGKQAHKHARLNKAVKDTPIILFKSTAIYKLLDEAGRGGRIFNFAKDEEARGRPSRLYAIG